MIVFQKCITQKGCVGAISQLIPWDLRNGICQRINFAIRRKKSFPMTKCTYFLKGVSTVKSVLHQENVLPYSSQHKCTFPTSSFSQGNKFLKLHPKTCSTDRVHKEALSHVFPWLEVWSGSTDIFPAVFKKPGNRTLCDKSFGALDKRTFYNCCRNDIRRDQKRLKKGH